MTASYTVSSCWGTQHTHSTGCQLQLKINSDLKNKEKYGHDTKKTSYGAKMLSYNMSGNKRNFYKY